MIKQLFCSRQPCFLNVLPRLTNIMIDKGFKLFDECAARCVHLSLRKKSAAVAPEGTVKCTHLAVQQIHRGR